MCGGVGEVKGNGGMKGLRRTGGTEGGSGKNVQRKIQ